ncbi:hypothetical protein [Curtobacterium sp. 314Chir4.1]|uniref:hypothetical protein n=1 Tax=Curtobacterium sp. 314Chir4.1 TaxID=1279028 RepID=UPI001142A428|nr:hypothetical protein [Curtobacterium sp. 314Chir4.1]
MAFAEFPRETLQAQRASTFLSLRVHRCRDDHHVADVEAADDGDHSPPVWSVDVPPVQLAAGVLEWSQSVTVGLARIGRGDDAPEEVGRRFSVRDARTLVDLGVQHHVPPGIRPRWHGGT